MLLADIKKSERLRRVHLARLCWALFTTLVKSFFDWFSEHSVPTYNKMDQNCLVIIIIITFALFTDSARDHQTVFSNGF